MRIEQLAPDEVFVFGSNAQGMHGGGAALFAHERFGAVWGQAEGLQGQSYGIDTMSGLEVFRAQAERFVQFASEHPELRFLVTEVGCGIAGYTPKESARFFRRRRAPGSSRERRRMWCFRRVSCGCWPGLGRGLDARSVCRPFRAAVGHRFLHMQRLWRHTHT